MMKAWTQWTVALLLLLYCVQDSVSQQDDDDDGNVFEPLQDRATVFPSSDYYTLAPTVPPTYSPSENYYDRHPTNYPSEDYYNPPYGGEPPYDYPSSYYTDPPYYRPTDPPIDTRGVCERAVNWTSTPVMDRVTSISTTTYWPTCYQSWGRRTYVAVYAVRGTGNVMEAALLRSPYGSSSLGISVYQNACQGGSDYVPPGPATSVPTPPPWWWETGPPRPEPTPQLPGSPTSAPFWWGEDPDEGHDHGRNSTTPDNSSGPEKDHDENEGSHNQNHTNYPNESENESPPSDHGEDDEGHGHRRRAQNPPVPVQEDDDWWEEPWNEDGDKSFHNSTQGWNSSSSNSSADNNYYGHPQCVPGHQYDRVRWTTQKDVMYTVVVHGRYSWSNGEEDFVLDIEDTLKSRNVCNMTHEDLGRLVDDGTLSTIGSTEEGTHISGFPSCQNAIRQKTVTYTVTVAEANVFVRFFLQGNVQITVFGGGCNNNATNGWTCAGDNRRSQNYAAFSNVEADTTYLVAISEQNDNNDNQDFLLTVNATGLGSICEDTVEVNLEEGAFSETSTLWDKPVIPNLYECSYSYGRPLQMPVALYKFTGNGGTLVANVASLDYSFQPRLILYDASAVTCDGGENSTNTGAPELDCLVQDEWNRRIQYDTGVGQSYLLALYAENDRYDHEQSQYRGRYTIDLQLVEYGDVCQDSVALEQLTQNQTLRIVSSTLGANLYRNLRACNYYRVQSLARIFSFTPPTNGFVLARVRALADASAGGDDIPPRRGNLQVSAFRGTCSYPSSSYCPDNFNTGYDGDFRTASWDVRTGEVYHVVVFSSDSDMVASDFELLLDVSTYGDACEDAIPMDLADGLSLAGSTKEASLYQFDRFCYDSIRSPAVIYKFRSETDVRVVALVESSEMSARVALYQSYGSSCNSDSRWTCTGSHSGSRVNWEAEANAEYYLVVFGCCGRDATGDFVLEFEMSKPGDVCDDVVDLGVMTDKSMIVSNSTLEAPFYSIEPCSYYTREVSPTRIFSVTASTTGKINVKTAFVQNFRPYLSIYSGACESMECISQDSYANPSSWDAVEGTVYFIAVRGRQYTDAGTFTLVLDAIESSSVCDSIEDLGSLNTSGLVLTDTTSGSPLITGLPRCNSPPSSPAKVYTVTPAESGTITASVGSSDSDANVRLLIYSGACDGQLSCIGEYERNRATWAASQGETYTIVVYRCCGNAVVGAFILELDLTDTGAVCEDTVDLGFIHDKEVLVEFGSTEEAGYYPFLADCYRNAIRSRASVYAIKSNSSTAIYASVRQTDERRYFRPQIAVYGGSCDTLHCESNINGYRSGPDHSWEAEEGEVYYVFVFGYNLEQYGEFLLRLEAATRHSICDDVIDLGQLPSGTLTEAGDTFEANLYDLPTCDQGVDSPAKVYKMKTQAGSVTAKVFGFNLNARIAVYRGDCTSDELECVSRRDSQEVTWEAAQDEAMFVVIYGCCDNNAVGDFVLRIETSVPQNPCDSVIELGVLPESGILTRGSTVGGPTYQRQNLTDCFGYGEGSVGSPSATYTVIGNGGSYQATVVGEDYYNPHISVYEGVCGNLNCTGTASDNRAVTWDTVDGRAYHIIIQALWSNNAGDFVLSIESSSSVDVCTDAEDLGNITGSRFLSGTTTGLGLYTSLPYCLSRITSPAKVYSMRVGSKRIISVSVDSASMSAQVSVYQGNCTSGLVCIQGNDRRGLQWEAQPNRNYYIVVYGCCGYRASGDFLLKLDSEESGDVCRDAIAAEEVSSEGWTVSGSTEQGKFYNLTRCGYRGIRARSNVYSLSGTGGLLSAAVTRTGYGYSSPELSVYNGTCQSPTCQTFNYGYNSMTWPSFDNATYHLVISGCCDYDAITSYMLSVRSIPTKDICTEAIQVEPSPNNGSSIPVLFNESAFFPEVEPCHSRERGLSSGVFTITGSGDIIVAELLGSYVREAGMSLMKGNCTSLQCLGGYGWDRSISWTAEQGTQYYLSVFADGSMATDSHVSVWLSIKKIPTVSVCDWDDVVEIDLVEGDTLIASSTEGGPVFGGLDYCFDTYSSRVIQTPGTAFVFEGNGDAYVLSVEDVDGFSAEMNVFKGPCDALQCATNYTYNRQNVLLQTEIGEEYTVVIADCCQMDRTGSFKLRIRSVKRGNVVDDATDLGVDLEDTSRASGSTVDSPFYSGLSSCYDPVRSPAVVYKIQTSNRLVSVSVTGFDFNARVAAYKENESGGLECHGDYEWRQVSWSAEEDETIYLVVHGCCALFSVGSFVLNIRSRRIGDICGTLTDLGVLPDTGLLHSSTTAAATTATLNAPNVSSCGNHYQYSPRDISRELPASLFKIDGHGSPLQASLYVPSSYSSNTALIAYTGSCDALECIDDLYGYSSQAITWTAEVNRSYFVLVYSCCNLNRVSDFSLVIQNSGPPPLATSPPWYSPTRPPYERPEDPDSNPPPSEGGSFGTSPPDPSSTTTIAPSSTPVVTTFVPTTTPPDATQTPSASLSTLDPAEGTTTAAPTVEESKSERSSGLADVSSGATVATHHHGLGMPAFVFVLFLVLAG